MRRTLLVFVSDFYFLVAVVVEMMMMWSVTSLAVFANMVAGMFFLIGG